MTTRNIDDQLRQYYTGAALEPASLVRLRGVLTKTEAGGASPAEKRDPSMRAWQMVALAASISVVFLAGALLVLREPAGEAPRAATPGLSERLAQQAASRHGRCVEEIDFQAEDLERLIVQMQKIDFTAGVPSRRGLDRMKVKGAHYCVLDGQIAIHAVLVDESGELVSLFETKAGPNMASLRSASHRMDGKDIDLWRESGVLYAAVFTAPATQGEGAATAVARHGVPPEIRPARTHRSQRRGSPGPAHSTETSHSSYNLVQDVVSLKGTGHGRSQDSEHRVLRARIRGGDGGRRGGGASDGAQERTASPARPQAGHRGRI